MDYASLPSVPEVCFPSMEAFNVNPIAFFEGLRGIGREFGAVKVKPPPDWAPPFALQALLKDQLLFNVRTQEIHSLMHGKPFKHPETPFQASALRERDRQVREQVFGSSNPSVETVEAMYWQSVEKGAPQLVAHYAADLKTNELGSGFPRPSAEQMAAERGCGGGSESFSSPTSSRLPSPQKPSASAENGDNGAADAPGCLYASHPWNLSRLATSEGSLLQHFHRDVPGVTSPWLYVGMIFASFCWHTEDNFFAACNYHHWGEPKIWYVVPPSRAPSVERALQSYLANKDPQYVLHSLTVQLPPSLFVENGIPVYRMEQRSGEFVMLWPRTYHAGFNVGFNCNEACNFAPPLWLQWGHKSVRSYKYMRSTCIPYPQLLLRAAAYSSALSAPQQLDLCRAVGRLLLEEFASRRAAWQRQVAAAPMQVSLLHLEKAKALPSDAKGWRADLKAAVEFLSFFLSPLLMPFDARAEARRWFLPRLAEAVALPVKDCGSCRASLVLSAATCPHNDEHVCLDCIDTLPCPCAQRVVLVRVPLPSLRVVFEHCLHLFELKAAAEEGFAAAAAPAASGGADETLCKTQASRAADSLKRRRCEREALLRETETETATAAESAAPEERDAFREKRRGRPASRPGEEGLENRRQRGVLSDAVRGDALLRAVPSLQELWNFEQKTHGGVTYCASVHKGEVESRWRESCSPLSTNSVRVTTTQSPNQQEGHSAGGLAKCRRTSATPIEGKLQNLRQAAARPQQSPVSGDSQSPAPPERVESLSRVCAKKSLGRSGERPQEPLEATTTPLGWQRSASRSASPDSQPRTPGRRREKLSLTAADWKSVRRGGSLDNQVGRLSSSQEPQQPQPKSPSSNSNSRSTSKAKANSAEPAASRGKSKRRGRKRLAFIPPEPVTDATRAESVRSFVKRLSWRLILQTLREEEQEDDELILPLFQRAAPSSGRDEEKEQTPASKAS